MKSRRLTLFARVIMVAGILVAWASVALAQTEPLNCDDWNTLEFFEAATADDVMACLAMGADVQAWSDDRDRYTPLHRAAEVNTNPAVLEALLDAGADPNSRAILDMSPLHLAAGNENVAVIEALIEGEADVHAQDALGDTPLFHAAGNSENIAVIQSLMNAGANLEHLNEYGWSIMHHASMNESVEVVRHLIDLGGDVNAQDSLGDTPLLFSAGGGIRLENVDVVQTLISAGADLSSQGNEGSALHEAASWPNSVAKMRLLIDAGIDINVRSSSSGRTPLLRARGLANFEFLLANGADPRSRAANGDTALHRAGVGAADEASAIVGLLVNAGVAINSRNEDGQTPLHLAVARSPSQMDALLEHGADIDAQDAEGNTALHVAAGCSLSRCWSADGNVVGANIITLLEAGADATIANAQGQTPWDLAMENENEQLSGSEGYWQLNEARFNTPSRFDPTAGSSGSGGTVTPNRQRAATIQDSGFQGFELPDENRREVFGDPPPVARVTQSAGGGQCDFQWMLDDSPPPTDITDIRLSWCNAPDTMIQIHLRANAAATQQCQLVYWKQDGRPSADIDGLAATIRQACAYLDAESATNNVNCRCPDWYGR